MNPEIRDLYNQYLHKRIGRREFVKKLSVLAGGTLAANTLLSLVERSHAAAAIVSQTTPAFLRTILSIPVQPETFTPTLQDRKVLPNYRV